MFLLPLFSQRDRSRLEFFCYSAVDVPDPFTQMLATQSDGWTDVRALDDTALAARIRSDGIDVLIDLSGHTSDNRLPVFARRPAPVQATWLGFPGTTGAPGIDYRYTDAVLDPPGSEGRSTEEPVRLAGGYFCYAPLADWGGALPVAALPAQCTGRITFGTFNNLAKVSPACLDLWAEVMRRVTQSRLVCRAKPFDDADERARFADAFVRRGVDAVRIETLAYLPDPAQHLRIYNDVDIHLDSVPYAGGTTTCDALWMGAPVVTLAGDRPSARLGASVLTALALPELIATDAQGYVMIAANLARDVERLAALRAGLRQRFALCPLHDAPAFAREFERACRSLWRRWCERAAP
jgi:predicted O-linked N-acetylglucosamine transferase (SPINDLY family)